MLRASFVAAAACTSPKQGDADPVKPPTADIEAAPTPQAAARPVAVPEPDAAPSAPKEVADSQIPRTKRVVSKKVQPGLVDFAKALPNKGLLWVGRLEGNGGRDVLLYIPPRPDNAAEFKLVYHFHGTYSEHIQRKEPDLPKKKWVGWDRLQQTIDAAAELQKKSEYNVALVYPLSAGKRREPDLTGWWNKAYDRMWMLPLRKPDYRDSFEKLHTETLAILVDEFGVHASKLEKPAIAEGHSAGGIALRHIAVTGTSDIGEYIFLDAGFQGWADGCFEAARASDSKPLVTLVITNNGIADPFGKRDPWCQTLEEEQAELPEEWEEYEAWCTGMKSDMKDVPGIYVHRTKVFHGDQPRRFTGGLELPPDRFKKLVE